MIRDNVKLICKMQGRKLSEIAEALNITRQSLHRFLTGSPNLDTVQRIAAALDVPAWIILHPTPAAALVQIRTGQVPEARTSNAGTIQAARLLCPICGSRLQIQIRPDGSRAPSHDPDSRTEGQEEGRPEE